MSRVEPLFHQPHFLHLERARHFQAGLQNTKFTDYFYDYATDKGQLFIALPESWWIEVLRTMVNSWQPVCRCPNNQNLLLLSKPELPCRSALRGLGDFSQKRVNRNTERSRPAGFLLECFTFDFDTVDVCFQNTVSHRENVSNLWRSDVFAFPSAAENNHRI